MPAAADDLKSAVAATKRQALGRRFGASKRFALRAVHMRALQTCRTPVLGLSGIPLPDMLKPTTAPFPGFLSDPQDVLLNHLLLELARDLRQECKKAFASFFFATTSTIVAVLEA